MSEFLLAYIRSYDVMFSITNGVCSLIFGSVVFLMSRKFGIVHGDVTADISAIWLLIASMVCCVIVFVVNFMSQGIIASFFSQMYLSEIPETELESKISWLCDPTLTKSAAAYFQCVREQHLWVVNLISGVSFVMAILFILTWAILQVWGRRFRG